MDDCTLEKLGVSPGALTPKFHRDTLEYNVTVASNVEKVKFDVLTSDSGASYQIKNSGGEKTIPLKEGDVTNVQIEVTAEDGTVKIYAVNVKRLSASDATLTTLQLSAGALEPEFAPGTYTYSTTLPCHVSSLTITAKAPDPKAGVKVCGQAPDTPVQLNVGETQVDVEVTSPDGSRQQVYSISVVKEPMGRFVKLADPKLALQLECPVTLGPLYRPISIRESDPKHTYSAPCIDVLTRTSKQDPLDESPLPSEWRIVDFDVDKKVSAAVVSCIYTHAGCTEQMKYVDLGAHAKDCQHRPKPEPNAALVTDSPWYKADFASTKKTDSDIKHKVEVRSWEKHLHNVTDSTLKELDDQAKEHLKNYREALPRIGQNQSYEHGKSPLDYLRNAAQCYATSIKMKGKDASLHCSLGLVLEEQYYAKDMYGLKEQDEEDDLGLAGLNLAAKESSKEEEIDAICNLRGVPATAPLARKLKAVDEEFHHLLDGGQTGKAEHVQALYAWKSKQATQDGKVAQQAEDETNTLGQAYLKFLDALSLDQSHTLYNLHVGRMLLLQGKTTEAQARLQLSVGMNPKNQAARFYLGLAMAMSPKGPPQDRLSETITFLNEGVETVLAQRCALAEGTAAQSQPNLHSEDLWRLSNLQMLRGFQLLGQLLAKQDPPQGCMSALDVLHNATLLSSQAMCEMVHRGEVYRQVEWMLLTSHYQLLEHLAAKQAGKEDLIALRCRDLSALIRACSIPQNTELLAMQEKTCQKGVLIRPCDSSALCHLAYAQLARYDDEPSTDAAARALRDSRLTFHTCIGLEGKPVVGDPLSEITGQQWWQDKVAKEEEEKKAAEAAKKPAAAPTGPARGAAARGRAAPAAAARGGRGAATASVANPKSVPSSPPPPKPGTPAGRGAAVPSPSPPPKPSTPTGRGATVPPPKPGTPTGRGAAVPSTSPPPKSGTPAGRGAAAGKSAISTSKPASVQKAQSSTTSTSSTKTNSSSSKTPAGRGAISTTKSSAAQKAPARGRGAPAAKAAPAPRGGAARGGAAGKAAPPARGGPAARGGAAKPAPAPVAGKPGKPGEKAEDKPATPTKATEPEKAPAPIPANTPLNRASYRPRLGLARALARTDDTIDDAKKWYNEVMTMAPEIHDAYIELADMLIKAEPLAAVDVYCRFPFPEELTFDDAYIHGEVVRILMKHEKFDDPRLADSMIAFGRVMGITTLDKYVSILDDKFKTDMLKKIYAGVHGKAVDDPDLQAFFKFKCWD